MTASGSASSITARRVTRSTVTPCTGSRSPASFAVNCVPSGEKPSEASRERRRNLRRGRPSCHKAFDEATALLAGDANDEELQLSLFDGRQAVLYRGKLNERGQLVGECWHAGPQRDRAWYRGPAPPRHEPVL